MLNAEQLTEIRNRLESDDCDRSAENLRAEAQRLLTEVDRLREIVKDYGDRVMGKLKPLEADMEKLAAENQRLLKLRESADFERDACVGLIAQLAQTLGIPVGKLRNHVIVDLPSGQVSWDYLDEDAHLFAELPSYPKPLQSQSVQEVYRKVLNPGLDF